MKEGQDTFIADANRVLLRCSSPHILSDKRPSNCQDTGAGCQYAQGVYPGGNRARSMARTELHQ